MDVSDAIRLLERDLRTLFGPRLRSVIAYGRAGVPAPDSDATLALVDHLTADDLRAAADRIASWHDAGLATPLVLAGDEFARSLDAFPYEFGAILSDHVVVAGEDPFAGLRVDPADFRRACEVQARSHLLHLREGYLETRGRSDAVADLISRSAPAFVALVSSLNRLEGLLPRQTIGHAHLEEFSRLAAGTALTAERARQLFPEYLATVERIVHQVDRWTADA